MSDWETVTILRKKPPKASAMRTEQAINAARRQGAVIETQQKYGGGQNKQHVVTKNIAKLDRETEELKHEKITLDTGKLIQQGRQSKGWSQKELATKINEKPQVINDYEAGRAIPNQAVLGKMEKALGVYTDQITWKGPWQGNSAPWDWSLAGNVLGGKQIISRKSLFNE